MYGLYDPITLVRYQIKYGAHSTRIKLTMPTDDTTRYDFFSGAVFSVFP